MRCSTIAPFLLLVAASCGGGEYDAISGDGSDDSPSGDSDSDAGDDGGGGVTFGGAQDIGEFRGLLEAGEIPGPNTLDANGFFNEHWNPPPPGPCTTRLCLNAGLSVGKDWVTGQYQAALQLSVNTSVSASDFERLPMNLVVVVDHSGSMASDLRLEKVKTGLHTLIDSLEDADRLSIISFDDLVTVDAPFTATLDRPNLHTVVDALEPRGATNIYDGLRAGLDALGEPPNERQNRVIFLSDGRATAGNTDPVAIKEMALGYVSRGIGLTTVGVGLDFDVALMRGLAESGAGNFYFVEDAEAATEVFTDELAYFLTPIALDVELTATSAPGWSFTDVVGSTLWEARPTSGEMKIPAVFLASRTDQAPDPTGGRRGGGSMIFIGLDANTTSAGRVAELALSYRLPDSTERLTHSMTLDYDRDPSQTLEDPYLSYPSMHERYAMYNTFLALKLAATLAEDDYGCALAVLTAARTVLAAWVPAHEEDQDLAADLALVDLFIANLRATGTPERTVEQCISGIPSDDDVGDDDDWSDDYSDDDYYGEEEPRTGMFMCSTGGNPSSPVHALVVVGALVVIARRRRSRR